MDFLAPTHGCASEPCTHRVRALCAATVVQPANGQYNSTSFANLERMLAMARDAGLAINLSVFVGGMSGRLYWPTWVTGNIYSDPAMSAATEAFARKVRWTPGLSRAPHHAPMARIGTVPPDGTAMLIVVCCAQCLHTFPGRRDGSAVRRRVAWVWPRERDEQRRHALRPPPVGSGLRELDSPHLRRAETRVPRNPSHSRQR